MYGQRPSTQISNVIELTTNPAMLMARAHENSQIKTGKLVPVVTTAWNIEENDIVLRPRPGFVPADNIVHYDCAFSVFDGMTEYTTPSEAQKAFVFEGIATMTTTTGDDERRSVKVAVATKGIMPWVNHTNVPVAPGTPLTWTMRDYLDFQARGVRGIVHQQRKAHLVPVEWERVRQIDPASNALLGTTVAFGTNVVEKIVDKSKDNAITENVAQDAIMFVLNEMNVTAVKQLFITKLGTEITTAAATPALASKLTRLKTFLEKHCAELETRTHQASGVIVGYNEGQTVQPGATGLFSLGRDRH